MAKLKGIVFDLDGTLVDSFGLTLKAFNHALASQGEKQRTADEIMRFFGPGERQIFAAMLGSEAKAQAAYAAYRSYVDENLSQALLHAGVTELLEGLGSAGLPVSIFTGRSWATTEIILRHHRCLERFVTIVAHDHVTSAKPSPEGLLLALRRMGNRAARSALCR